MKLTVDNIQKAYHQGTSKIPVLNGVSFEVNEGEVVAVLGPSGSGKSTLLSLLSGLDLPDRGQIRLGDHAIESMSEDDLARFRAQHIGIVFQQFHLMTHLNALENVALPLEILGQADAEEQARQSLDKVGLLDRATHFPHQLSGGEKQRVALARALVTRPHLLLADEPTGSLDQGTGAQVTRQMFDLIRAHQMTTIVVTHSEELAARCDRRLQLKGGVLVEAGA